MADETTLRTMGEGLRSFATDTAETLSTSGPVDWPIWVFVVGAPFAIFAIMIVYGWVAELSRDLLRSQSNSYGVPDDPHERSMWANRTGKYAVDPAERERWHTGKGEYSDDPKEREDWAQTARSGARY